MPAPRDPPASSDETAVRPAEAFRDATERFTPGTLLAGRYRIVSPLGRGGMGEVYRADDIRLGQPVALKFLPAALAADSGRLQRLVDEVRIGRQISHPNVCRLYDIAEAEGHHFLVMEYVDGEDLASLLSRIGHLPGDKALDIARGVCAGLAAAHDMGVIHRDLKPANVMIDGRGHARIADFGLAALAESGAVVDMSGTPQYMAPEQLTGEGASLRSDVYALGLVLHEMLTGKRVFDAKSLTELRALHADTKPPGLSSSASDVDPAFERLILRCLDRNPNDRPASARVVLASLPGGDQLEAAMLAGETPSPEMVAAANKVGDLRPTVAWACLIAGLLGLLSIPILGRNVMLFRRVPLPKSPDALSDRARDVLSHLGYREAAADSAYGFFADWALLNHIREDPSGARERLLTARPGPFLFFYRSSPAPLVSTSWIPNAPWEGPAELGRVWFNDPPLDLPGMTRVVLDSQGRLTRFAAVAPRFHPDPTPGTDPDWSTALTEAGFDPARLKAAASHWAGPGESDRKAAWDGTMQGQPDLVFHIEAASYRGRLVYFELQGPWVEPPSATSTDSTPLTLVITCIYAGCDQPTATSTDSTPFTLVTGLIIVFFFGMVPAWAVLVRRNLRLGRSDRKGALRLAAFMFVSAALADLLRADHTASPLLELHLLVQIISQGLYFAVLVWVCYVAMEPTVRRRWPHTLISWNRLLAGRFGDPLMGRDVIVGTLAGVLAVLDLGLGLPLVLLGRAVPVSFGAVFSSLDASRHQVYLFFAYPAGGVLISLVMLFTLNLFHALVRRAWLARLVVFLLIMAPSFAIGLDPVAALIKGGIVAGIMVFVLARFGLVACATAWFTFYVLLQTPLTLDWTAWYAGRSFAVLGFFAAVLVAAFYTSLGGKPLFGKALLDD